MIDKMSGDLLAKYGGDLRRVDWILLGIIVCVLRSHRHADSFRSS
jgi:hypothetical protein